MKTLVRKVECIPNWSNSNTKAGKYSADIPMESLAQNQWIRNCTSDKKNSSPMSIVAIVILQQRMIVPAERQETQQSCRYLIALGNGWFHLSESLDKTHLAKQNR